MINKLVIASLIAAATFVSGCSVPENPELRIAISASPGSAVLYLAQEAGLFKRYNVDVKIVELNSGCECCMAFMDDDVDAVVMPYGELEVLEKSESAAGILMLLAAPLTRTEQFVHDLSESDWGQSDVEILVGNRSNLMLRRQEWQRVLLAFEHARLLLAGEQELQLSVIAERERRSIEELNIDMSRWEIFGIMLQDSLLSSNGPYSALNAKWHGRQFLTAAALSQFNNTTTSDDAYDLGHKVR